MRVSVLVPVFNNESYLDECLKSILMQDFSDVEIIVADDASTDGSVEIIERFAARDSRIRWWTNPRNLGLIGNSNACLKAAKGEFIKFVHADDALLCPSAIRKMVAALDAHPDATLAACKQHFTKVDFGKTLEPHVYSEQSGCVEGKQIIVTCLEQDANVIGNPTMTLFRRSHACRGFDERFTQYLDLEMWFHLLEQGSFVFLAETLATWRLHSKQLSALMYGNEPSEGLLLLQTYYAKTWLQAAATPKMLFIQSRSLRKKYGARAAELAGQMQTSLPRGSFLTFWVDRKLRKISRWFNKNVNRFQREPPAVC